VIEHPLVLAVDNHAEFRAAAGKLLESAGFVIAGEAADGVGALSAVRSLRPEVVLLDVQLPDIDGFELAKRLADDRCEATVVLVSAREARDYGGRVERSHSAGFILKNRFSAAGLRSLLPVK
jgi:DNA-binding NarL/FixJ family response regulator